MTEKVSFEPWRGLPVTVADLIEPELEETTIEILATIAAEVPEYQRPLEGSFGRGLRTGVAEALSQFVALIRNPDAGRVGREVYVALGRGELRQGRTLDSLQAAYRVGARVAWRRVAAAGLRAGLDAELLSLLAEAIFAYIDELAADSVEGYAEARSQGEELRARRRRELFALLIQQPPADPADIRAVAHAAGWKLPRRLAPLACDESELAALGRRLPADVLRADLDEVGCVLVPDPDGPGRAEQLARAVESGRAALGPACEPADTGESWRIAKAALAAMEAGVLPASGLLAAEDHLTELLVFGQPAIVNHIVARRLAPLRGLTPRAQRRMRETALAYVQHTGNAVAMAAALQIHPQTVRQRLVRLRELFGEQLDDPDARLELEIALRAAALSADAA